MIRTAKWITSPRDAEQAVYTYSKNFSVSKDIARATLYASAIGVYTPYINEKRIGRGVLAPGWTSYQNRVQYQAYDITELIGKDNCLEIGVGQGWAVGYIGYLGTNHFSADHVSLIASVELEYKNGDRELIVTDESWSVYTSRVTFAEIYHGETVDMTAPVEFVGHAKPSEVNTSLVEQMGEWVTEQERLSPISVFTTPKGERIVDFGQNLTGYVELKIKAPRGSRIVIRHAEVLDKNGNFYNENYRTARNEMTYVCSGGEDIFKPQYSFQGFRYIKLCEYPSDQINKDCFCAIAVHSDMKRTGYFTCGNDKINQLYHNILWGQKGNYLDVPTDCPQRDERLGWTGDAQVFFRAGAINYDVEKFFQKWLGDVALEQRADGSVIGVVPAALKVPRNRVSAGWGDVACIIPWGLYVNYGNKELLRESFPMMKKWVDYMHSAGREEFLWLDGNHYGDWLAIDGGEDSYVGATSTDMIASAYFAYSTSLLVKAGEVLGEDMTEYRELYRKVRGAFREYFMEGGMPKQDIPFTLPPPSFHAQEDSCGHGITQTGISLILHFGLCEESERETLANKLVELIKQYGMRMSTGFIGTPYIMHALSDNGYTDVAYELLFQEKSPSWLYSVCHGATTMWEHWNSIKEDGSFWSTDMNSFNHYAYGAVFDWIFGVACGIKACEYGPAYKFVSISPHPDKRLGFANASIDTRNGSIRVNWYYKEDKVYYEIYLPEGVTANLTLPSGYKQTLDGGNYFFTE